MYPFGSSVSEAAALTRTSPCPCRILAQTTSLTLLRTWHICVMRPTGLLSRSPGRFYNNKGHFCCNLEAVSPPNYTVQAEVAHNLRTWRPSGVSCCPPSSYHHFFN